MRQAMPREGCTELQSRSAETEVIGIKASSSSIAREKNGERRWCLRGRGGGARLFGSAQGQVKPKHRGGGKRYMVALSRTRKTCA